MYIIYVTIYIHMYINIYIYVCIFQIDINIGLDYRESEKGNFNIHHVPWKSEQIRNYLEIMIRGSWQNKFMSYNIYKYHII